LRELLVISKCTLTDLAPIGRVDNKAITWIRSLLAALITCAQSKMRWFSKPVSVAT